MVRNKINNKNGKIRKELKELLPIIYSRTFSTSIRGIDKFILKNLKNVPITKSRVFKISGVTGEIDNGYVPMIPMVIAVKKYQDAVERTSEHYARSTKNEYDMESTILSLGHILKHEKGNETYLVYPKHYSPQIEECDEKLYIFREFIPGGPLGKIASEILNSKKSDEIEWENIDQSLKNPLYSISLLHVKGPDLEKAFPSGLELPSVSLDNLIDGFSHYLWRISEKKLKLRGLKKEVGRAQNLFKILTPKQEPYLSVINGDLDVYTGHVIITENKSRLLDSGSTEKSAIFRDLAVYSDPSFSPIMNIEKVVSKEYIETRNKLEDELHLDQTKFNLDELVLGFCVAAFRGNIRRAASLINYKKDQVRNRNTFKKQVAAHVNRGLYFLDKLQKMGPKDINKAAKRLEKSFEKYDPFSEYLDYMEKDKQEKKDPKAEVKKEKRTSSVNIKLKVDSTIGSSLKRILLKPSEIINISRIMKYIAKIFIFNRYYHQQRKLFKYIK